MIEFQKSDRVGIEKEMDIGKDGEGNNCAYLESRTSVRTAAGTLYEFDMACIRELIWIKLTTIHYSV